MINLRTILPSIILLAACTSINTPVVETTIQPSGNPSESGIQFEPTITVQPVNTKDAVANITFLPAENTFGEWQAVDFGFYMDVGIYAVSKDIAFLLGSLSVPAGTSQSTLLRTVDGGSSWTEVMEPIPANTVLEINILENGSGWALLMWTVEDPGNITLYRTQNYGITWDELTVIENSSGFGFPIRMTFVDQKHGQINIVYDQGLPETNRIAILNTEDGGLTWQESDALRWKDLQSFGYDKILYFNALSKFIEQYSSDYSQSTGMDNSQWKIETNKDQNQITIRKRLMIGDWMGTSILPYRYGFADGKVTIP